jgi:hypothetical protein
MMNKFSLFLGTVAAVTLAGNSAMAQRDLSKVQIKAIPVQGGVTMLMGAGGNIGVLAGDDGVFMIDGQFKPLSDKIKAAVSKISASPA